MSDMMKNLNGIYKIKLRNSDSLVSMLPVGNHVSLLPGEEAKKYAKWELKERRSGVYTIRDQDRGLFLSFDRPPRLNGPVFGAKEREECEWCLEPVRQHGKDGKCEGDEYLFVPVAGREHIENIIMGRSHSTIIPPAVALVPRSESCNNTWVLERQK